MSKLFIIPTPIGNLEDITFRAIRLLKEVHLILAEDTRQTSKLLQHYNIQNRLMSFHQYNEHQSVKKIIDLLLSGTTMGLVSDAGTPGISDPAFLLVRACIDNNIEVECLPGPTAFVPALVQSGFPTDRFVFEGFLPHKKGRQKRLKALTEETRTLVFYESPYRLIKALEEFKTYFGENRMISVCREISKMFHETRRGTAAELIQHYTNHPPKGEIVLVVSGKNETQSNND
ncbi:MAG: 16S rRNA (cytidine(1402)-2'-O)-methyltransferase [Flavobacteriales bacterium]|nr:16S rRNA (cytidine(1402)-2'-O)-methyltransferase [Flavobacteriales bacterium]